jgi:hypothetical protein
MIGRKVTQIRGRSARPAFRASATTASIWSRVSANGSPHRPKMSAREPPTRYASADEPPTETGIVPFVGRTRLRKLSNL